LSKVLHRIEPYAALDADLAITPEGMAQQSWGVLGLNIHLGPVIEFIVEGGAGIKGTPSYLCAGLNLYLAR
jgi:hypothetical protein